MTDVIADATNAIKTEARRKRVMAQALWREFNEGKSDRGRGAGERSTSATGSKSQESFYTRNRGSFRGVGTSTPTQCFGQFHASDWLEESHQSREATRFTL